MGKKGKENESDELVVGLDVKPEETPEEKDFHIPSKPVIDTERVTVVYTELDKHHKAGDESKMAKANAKRLEELGLVKIKEEKKK